MIKNNFLPWLFMLWICSGLTQVMADEITVRDFALYEGESKEILVADIRFEHRLTDYLRASLLNGITLRSEIRFDLNWHNDWWWNKTEKLDSITADLTYDALSRQYQLVSKNSGKSWNFSNLAAALEHIGIVRKHALPALSDSAFKGDASIYIEARLQPVVAKSLDIPSKLSSLFGGEEHQLVSQGVLWPLTP